MPMMPFMGVRSSWLMLARKAVLARLAPSARSLAASSSTFRAFSASCSRRCSVMSRAAAKTPSTCPALSRYTEALYNTSVTPPEAWRMASG